MAENRGRPCLRPDELQVRCWCHESIVWAPIAVVRACLTLPCHRQRCKAMAAEERRAA